MTATTSKSRPSTLNRWAHSAVDAYKRNVALTETVLTVAPTDIKPTWVDTVDGPRLRGRNLPPMAARH